MNRIIEQAGTDLRLIPTYLRERQVRVISKLDTENGISMKCVERGYHHEINFIWESSRSQLQNIMMEYMNSELKGGVAKLLFEVVSDTSFFTLKQNLFILNV